MKIEKLDLPDKIFGMETGLLIVFLPLLLVVLLVIVSVNLLLVPKIDDYKTMSQQLSDLKSRSQLLAQKRNYMLSVDQNELKKNADLIIDALLPQKNAYLLVGMVSQIAGTFGYQIDSFLINPGEVVGKSGKPLANGVASIPVNLIIVGPTASYLDLVNRLESSLPVMSLEKFKMTNSGDVTKMDLTISAYYIETNSNININNLSLTDLALTKDESDLIAKLNQFTVLGNTGSLGSEFNTTKSFVKYNRLDPFTP
jgi:hypothetical protein